MRDLGPAKKIEVIDILRDRVKVVLALSQEEYLNKVISLFGLDLAKAICKHHNRSIF